MSNYDRRPYPPNRQRQPEYKEYTYRESNPPIDDKGMVECLLQLNTDM